MSGRKIGIVGAGLIDGTLVTKFASSHNMVGIANSKSRGTLTEFDDVDRVTPMFAANPVGNVDVAVLSLTSLRWTCAGR